MKVLAITLVSASSLLSVIHVNAFTTTVISRPFGLSGSSVATHSMATTEADCGCGDNIRLSGKPSDKARSIDPRQAVRKSSIYTIHGQETNMDTLIGIPTESGTSIVVFLRSLGWPLCQELILSYKKVREKLLANNVTLIMVSIGKPEIGKELVAHLQLTNGEHYLFVGKSQGP